jgi:hypothetical protein
MHKKKLILAVCTLAMMAGIVVGQHGTSIVRRVKFARGRTTAVLQGTIRRGVSNDYLLGARRGQDMTVHLASRGDVSFTVLTPSGQALSDFSRDWSGSLPESGDYRINVLPPTETSAPASYTLEITIR